MELLQTEMEIKEKEMKKKSEYESWVEEQKRMLTAAKLKAAVANTLPSVTGIYTYILMRRDNSI